MPNRRELAIPAVRVVSTTAKSGDAWTIIGFCTIGWLLSIYAAVTTLGVDALPRLMTQFPGLM